MKTVHVMHGTRKPELCTKRLVIPRSGRTQRCAMPWCWADHLPRTRRRINCCNPTSCTRNTSTQRRRRGSTHQTLPISESSTSTAMSRVTRRKETWLPRSLVSFVSYAVNQNSHYISTNPLPRGRHVEVANHVRDMGHRQKPYLTRDDPPSAPATPTTRIIALYWMCWKIVHLGGRQTYTSIGTNANTTTQNTRQDLVTRKRRNL